MTDHFLAAQNAAEEHLAACEDALWEAEGIDDPGLWPPSPALGPYDGCSTCQVREVLHAAWPHLKAAAQAGEEPWGMATNEEETT